MIRFRRLSRLLGFMSGKFPRVTSSDIEKALESEGFVLVRQKGSHKRYRRSDPPPTRNVTIPQSKGILPPKTVDSIRKQAGYTKDEWRELLN